MTPPDVLPYYLAIVPSPSDTRVAFAVARPAANYADVVVSVCVQDSNTCEEVFSFSRLASVLIDWSACGDLLAFAQGTTLMTRNTNGDLQLIATQDDVQAIGFDRGGRLWLLEGDRLETTLGGRSVLTFDAVEAFAVCESAAFARREAAGLCVYIVDGDRPRKVACIAGDFKTVRLSIAGGYLAVALLSTSIMDRVSACLFRVDLANTRLDKVLDCELPVGFNAGPGLYAAVARSGEIYAAYEYGACTRVWSLAPYRAPQPVSPDSFEVFDFVLHPHGAQLAVIASDTRTSEGSFDRMLLVGRRTNGRWQFLPPVVGVHDMPRWRADGLLEILSGDAGRWVKSTHDPERVKTEPRVPVLVSSLGSGAAELDLLHLPGTKHRQSGIIMLPRLHQQFVAGAQSYFFHHLLFSIARSLASDGHTVVVLCGPGAIGRGRRRREPAKPYIEILREALGEVAGMLRDEGCRSISLLAGSLAAVPALRLLGAGSMFSAGAFVAPLLEASIPVTGPVRRHLLDDPLIQPIDVATADLAVPLLVIHGALDEVAPLSQIAHLYRNVSDASLLEICILQGEGHIFRKLDSWKQAASRIQDFFASRPATSPEVETP
jgi:hypothetical protein